MIRLIAVVAFTLAIATSAQRSNTRAASSA
jgi:hypothetical protein